MRKCVTYINAEVLITVEVQNMPNIATHMPYSFALSEYLLSVASPGFVARTGKDGNYVIGTNGRTVDFRAGCSSCSMTYSFVTNAVLIERAASC